MSLCVCALISYAGVERSAKYSAVPIKDAGFFLLPGTSDCGRTKITMSVAQMCWALSIAKGTGSLTRYRAASSCRRSIILINILQDASCPGNKSSLGSNFARELDENESKYEECTESVGKLSGPTRQTL